METVSPPKSFPIWVSLVGDLKIVTDFLASKPVLSPWGPVIFIDALCRGFAQVLFANNTLTGLAVIIGLAVAEPLVAAAGVFTTAVALITSALLQQNREVICAGLTSYSAVIVGTVIMALAPGYLDPDNLDIVWLFLFFGAIFSVYLTIAMVNILATIQPALPCCTLPFNVVTFITLISFQMLKQQGIENKGAAVLNLEDFVSNSSVNLSNLAANDINMTDGGEQDVNHIHKLFIGTILSMSQVYAVENVASSIIIYLGLLICSPISAVMAFIGSAIGTFVGAAIIGPAGYSSAYAGLFGFNSLLTAAGLGGFFYVLTIHSFATSVLCALFTIIIQIAFAARLSQVSLPVCTLPFVTSTILFLATTTGSFGLQRPKSVTFPEMHCYELLARSKKLDSPISDSDADKSPAQERFLQTSANTIP